MTTTARDPFARYDVSTEHGCMVQVGPVGRCVFEIHAGGAVRYIGTSSCLPRRLREIWQRDQARLRSDFDEWTVLVWKHRTERAMLRERDRRLDQAMRWSVTTLRNAPPLYARP